MLKAESKNWITNFRRKWLALYFLRATALSLAIALILIAISAMFFVFPFEIWQLIITFLLVFGCFMVFMPTWKLTNASVVKYLDAKFGPSEANGKSVLWTKNKNTRIELENVSTLKDPGIKLSFKAVH